MSSARTRLILVCEEFRSTGGQERVMLELARGLASEFEVEVVTAEAWPGVFGDHPVTVHRVPRVSRPEALRFASFVLRAGRVVARRGSAIVHGVGANCPSADVVHLQTVNREKYRLLPELTPPGVAAQAAFALYRAAVDLAERRALRNPRSLFIAVSRRVGDEATGLFGTAPSRIRVIPNGVDRDHFRPPSQEERTAARRRLGVPEGVRLVGFVGADHARKGLQTLIAALSRRVVTDVHAVSMGGATRSIAAHRAEAAAAGVGDRVWFVEHAVDVRDAYWASDAFAFPTLYEPFGMAAAEAMACGLPSVLSPVAGLIEFLPKSSFVSLDDPRDPEGLAVALAIALQAPDRLATAAREATSPFAWDRVIAAIRDVYAELAAQRMSMASP